MTRRASLLGVALSVLIGAHGASRIQDLPAATEAQGAFALSDQAGSRLLVLPHLTRPDLLTVALCGAAGRIAVQFDRRQVAGANTHGRQTWRTFDNLAGSVFTVVGKSVDPDGPCFLAGETLLAGGTVLSVSPPAGDAACRPAEQFAMLRRRPIVHCWPLAAVGPQGQVALLEFQRRGEDALASLVVVDGPRTMFVDFPAKFRGAGDDLWRADDGGVLSPQGLTIVGAVQRGTWYALATAWAGAEGRSLSLWTCDGGDRFTKVINDYWYQAPR